MSPTHYGENENEDDYPVGSSGFDSLNTPLLQIEYEPMIADCSNGNGTADEQPTWLIVFLLTGRVNRLTVTGCVCGNQVKEKDDKRIPHRQKKNSNKMWNE